jgi:multidrug efflux pump subunit AcrA (membrane-fusion protein)
MVNQTLEEKMTDLELDAELAEAQAAADEMHAALEISQKAARLDGLLKAKQAQQKLRNAEITLERMTAVTSDRLEKVKPDISQWRSDFERVCKELDELVNQLPVIQGEIFGAGFNLQRASEAVFYSRNPGKIGRGNEADNDIPVEFSAQEGFSELWVKLGGLDDSLNIFPKLTGLSESLAAVIRQYYKKVIYIPKKGLKFFVRK